MGTTIDIEALRDAGLILIDKDVYRDMKSRQRKDLQRKICSTKEAMFILCVAKESFYDLSTDPKTKLSPSKLKGKWSMKSVYDEAERLNNY